MKLHRWQSVQDPNRAVGKLLADLVPSCLTCGSGFSGHRFALLATMVVQDEKDTIVSFFEAMKDHQWEKLRDFQSWLGNADNLEAYAIDCSERLTVIAVKTHFELLQGARLIYQEALPEEQSAKLLKVFASLHWHPF